MDQDSHGCCSSAWRITSRCFLSFPITLTHLLVAHLVDRLFRFTAMPTKPGASCSSACLILADVGWFHMNRMQQSFIDLTIVGRLSHV